MDLIKLFNYYLLTQSLGIVFHLSLNKINIISDKKIHIDEIKELIKRVSEALKRETEFKQIIIKKEDDMLLEMEYLSKEFGKNKLFNIIVDENKISNILEESNYWNEIKQKTNIDNLKKIFL